MNTTNTMDRPQAAHASLLQREQSKLPSPREIAVRNFHAAVNAALKPSLNTDATQRIPTQRAS